MTERSFILKDKMGLHARLAVMLMVRMLHVNSVVEIICGDRRADGKNVMSIMAMNIMAGDEVIFRIDGPDEEAAMKEAEVVLETGVRHVGGGLAGRRGNCPRKCNSDLSLETGLNRVFIRM